MERARACARVVHMIRFFPNDPKFLQMRQCNLISLLKLTISNFTAMSEISFTLAVGEDIKSTCQFDGSLKGLSGAIETVKTQINTIISNKMASNGGVPMNPG